MAGPATAAARTTGPTPAQVTQVRAFNRFYTNVIGVLHDMYLDCTPYTLTEGRLLFEIARPRHRRSVLAAPRHSTVDAQVPRWPQVLVPVRIRGPWSTPQRGGRAPPGDPRHGRGPRRRDRARRARRRPDRRPARRRRLRPAARRHAGDHRGPRRGGGGRRWGLTRGHAPPAGGRRPGVGAAAAAPRGGRRRVRSGTPASRGSARRSSPSSWRCATRHPGRAAAWIAEVDGAAVARSAACLTSQVNLTAGRRPSCGCCLWSPGRAAGGSAPGWSTSAWTSPAQAGYTGIVLLTYDQLVASPHGSTRPAGSRLDSEHPEDAFGQRMMSRTQSRPLCDRTRAGPWLVNTTGAANQKWTVSSAGFLLGVFCWKDRGSDRQQQVDAQPAADAGS